MSFDTLKRNRANSITKLVSAASGQNASPDKKSYVDERVWKPTVDKAGNGYAVLRFLPAAEGTELPWVRYWDHGFKGPTGQWYIEKSLTSIGQQDPVSEANTKLWNSGNERDKEIVRERKRRLHYVSNVFVESDSANPETEGQVKLFVFGKKIFDKVMDVMQPQFADEDPINPFDFWAGASFKLKIRNVEGYRNYDKSEFASQKPLSEDDEELETVYSKLHDLNEFSDPENYKSYNELQERLSMVLGVTAAAERNFTSVTETAAAPAPKTAPEPVITIADEDEDDTMSYFAKLAAEE
jgi:hypothetical protein|tara:strand:- start:189 stop:1079 length:891 start_codon:yes stop_codon:yes gene_type:complete